MSRVRLWMPLAYSALGLVHVVASVWYFAHGNDGAALAWLVTAGWPAHEAREIARANVAALAAAPPPARDPEET